jgi:hypothetical protein
VRSAIVFRLISKTYVSPGAAAFRPLNLPSTQISPEKSGASVTSNAKASSGGTDRVGPRSFPVACSRVKAIGGPDSFRAKSVGARTNPNWFVIVFSIAFASTSRSSRQKGRLRLVHCQRHRPVALSEAWQPRTDIPFSLSKRVRTARAARRHWRPMSISSVKMCLPRALELAIEQRFGGSQFFTAHNTQIPSLQMGTPSVQNNRRRII